MLNGFWGTVTTVNPCDGNQRGIHEINRYYEECHTSLTGHSPKSQVSNTCNNMVALGLVGIGQRELADDLVKTMMTGCDGQLVARLFRKTAFIILSIQF